ncbi:MAG TPA: Z1 domain-containing protein, partial [Flavitalea sp.]|nr:Z1 domain-containing protein [Flavitalea sp.]
YQHARMFGYRQTTLPYTKLFTTRMLYYRFRDIHASDLALRTFIEKHINDDPRTFPIDISMGLRPTRRGVLDANSVESITPGEQIYPNRMRLPQAPRSVNQVWTKLFEVLNVRNKNHQRLVASGRNGVLVSIEDAIELIASIRTNSENSWHDSSIQTVLTKLCENLGGRIRLKYRPAERTILEDGVISSGTLSGAEQATARLDQYPTLWIMDVTPRVPAGAPALPVFMFPTIVVPSRLPSVFVFTKR